MRCQDVLIENGADVLMMNNFGQTSFEMAAKTNYMPLFISLSNAAKKAQHSQQLELVMESFINFLSKNWKLVKTPMKYVMLLIKYELINYLDHLDTVAQNCWTPYLEYDQESWTKFVDADGYNVLHFAIKSGSVSLYTGDRKSAYNQGLAGHKENTFKKKQNTS